MKMTKENAEKLLEKVEELLKEERGNLQKCKDEIEIWTCAKAYLEFIINGIKRNPSLKKGQRKDE